MFWTRSIPRHASCCPWWGRCCNLARGVASSERRNVASYCIPILFCATWIWCVDVWWSGVFSTSRDLADRDANMHFLVGRGRSPIYRDVYVMWLGSVIFFARKSYGWFPYHIRRAFKSNNVLRNMFRKSALSGTVKYNTAQTEEQARRRLGTGGFMITLIEDLWTCMAWYGPWHG